MLNELLFVLLFIVSYLLVKRWQIRRQVNQFQKRNSVQEFSKDNSIKKLFSKFNWIKTKENDLFLQGYPLKLNAISYYFMKIIISFLFAIAGKVNYESNIVMILLGTVGFYLLDGYLSIRQKAREREICSDLLTVTNSMMMQLASFVPLKESLKKQYENCNNKDFKKAMMVFATKYELSALNIDTALNDLNSRFRILELDMFCNTIRQYNKVGSIIELLENLSATLKEKYMQQLKVKTKEKVIYITFGVILALTNIICIIFYPLFLSIGNNFNQIFK